MKTKTSFQLAGLTIAVSDKIKKMPIVLPIIFVHRVLSGIKVARNQSGEYIARRPRTSHGFVRYTSIPCRQHLTTAGMTSQSRNGYLKGSNPTPVKML